MAKQETTKQKQEPKKQIYPPAIDKRVEELKKEHKIDHVAVFHNQGRYAFVKKPDRTLLKMAISIADTKIDEAEILLENCWLEGDECFKNDDSVFLGIMPDILALIGVKLSELKKY